MSGSTQDVTPAPALSPETTRGEALAWLTRSFEAAGLEEAGVDARRLLCAAARLDHAALVRDPDLPLGAPAGARLAEFAVRRLDRMPVSRILGRRGFWTLDLLVSPDVLDPRPDSETLVEAALAECGERSQPLRIADLGCGSGALICALLDAFGQATGVAVDLSTAACAATRANLDALGLRPRAHVVAGDFSAALPGPYDLVVSNPPYVRTGDISRLDPEVRDFDPVLALDGGPDGLSAYRALSALLPRLLAPGGLAILEIGAGQAEDVAGLMTAAGLIAQGTRRDLAGLDRAVLARLRPAQLAENLP